MPKNDPQPNEPQPKKLDSRLASFLRKAGPIISTERGINARSRIKLESLAKDIKLPEELFEQGLQMLQDAPQQLTSRQNRWERAFAKRIRTQLESKSIGILTAKMEAKAIRVAKEKYQLEEVQAREIIQTVAKEVGIGRITVSEAERHVEELVRDKIGRSIWVDPSNRDWLHEAGREWGVEPTKIESLINLFVEENRRNQRRKKRLSNLTTLAVVVGIIIVLGAGISVLLVWSGSPINQLSESDNTDEDKPSTGGNSSPSGETPKWWDEQLQVGVIQARLNTNGFKPIYPILISDSPATRLDGYLELVRLLQMSFDDQQSVSRLIGIAANLVRLEPEETNAEALAKAIAGLLTPNPEALPEDRNHYSNAIELVDRIADAALDSGMPKPRQELLLSELGAVTGVGALRDASRALYVRRHQAGYCEAAYRALISAASSQPKQGLLRMEWLQAASRPYLDPARKLEFESQFLLTVIPSAPDDWARFQTNLLETMAAENPLLYRFITLAETTPNAELQRYLFSALCGILDVEYLAGNPEELASSLRRRLGVVPGMAEDEQSRRVARLQRRVAELPTPMELAGKPTAPNPTIIEKAAYLATLSCVLAQSPSRDSQFDLLLAKGSDLAEESESGTTTPEDSSTVRVNREPTRTDYALLERFVSRFDEWETAAAPQRVQSFNSLESLGARFQDITPEAAQPLAKYITGTKEASEHNSVVNVLDGLSHWNQLVLAVADQLETSPLPLAWKEDIAESFSSGGFLELSGNSNPNKALQTHLYQLVLDRITSKPALPIVDKPSNKLQQNFGLNYAARIEALSDSNSYGVDELIANQVEQYTKLVLPKRSSSIESTTKQFEAIRYLATNDLERCVFLQRVACQALVEKIKRSHPESANEASRLYDQLSEWDRSANHILTQLYFGEWVQLQLWLKLSQ